MTNKNLIAPEESESLTPEELFKRHVYNPKHVITEDEMKNLKIGDDAEDSEELNRKVEEKEAEDNIGNHENNPFDILDA